MPRGLAYSDPEVEARENAELGRRLRAFRLARGLSQNDLAAKTNIGAPAISNVEHGKRTLALRQIRAIARALRIHPGDFL